MIGDWGKGHLYVYPSQYRHTSAEELADLARFWHERGRVLTAWGCREKHGFLISYCHCHPDYCVPLRNQRKRGNRVFRPGYNFARVDPSTCVGLDGCGWGCVERCFFGAMRLLEGKPALDPEKCHGCGQCWHHCPQGAVSRVRKEGYRLSYCPPTSRDTGTTLRRRTPIGRVRGRGLGTRTRWVNAIVAFQAEAVQ